MIEINSIEQFETLIKENSRVLVDVYLPNCGPCKMMKPTIADMDNSYDDLTVLMVNGEKQAELAYVLNAKSVPTFISIKDEKIQDSVAGRKPNGFMKKWIENNLYLKEDK